MRSSPRATGTISSPAPTSPGEERSHPRLVEANPDPVAGRPWLGDLEHGRSDPEPVADADLVVGEPVDGEVLAELAVRQLGPPELPFPVAIRLDLIDEDRALLSPVAAEVALAITHEVEAIDPPTALDRVLPDSGVHGPPAPLDVAWKSDVDREQPSHRCASAEALIAPTPSSPAPTRRSPHPIRLVTWFMSN
jgi:hypothetical protein